MERQKLNKYQSVYKYPQEAERHGFTVHRYLRAIGFSKIKNREDLQNLINEVVERTLLHPSDKNKDEEKTEYVWARDIGSDE